MNSFTFNKANLIRFIIVSSSAFCLSLTFAAGGLSAQTKGKKPAAKQTAVKKPAAIPAADLPKVNQVDEVALLKLLKRDGENSKPLLVNFWATWCGPCVEEFPDLVKISDDYKGRIDVITVTLDELAEINTSVPQFLAKMKATMPTYLLKSTDENSAIESVSKDWQGGLPFTILYDGKGATVYSKQAKFVPAQLRGEIDKLISTTTASVSVKKLLDISALGKREYSYESGVAAANHDIAQGRLKILVYGLRAYSNSDEPIRRAELSNKYKIKVEDSGCVIFTGFEEFAKGYNETSTAAIRRKFGEKPLKLLGIL